MLCRFCKNRIKTEMVDLGLAPLSNEYMLSEQIAKGQRYAPLKAVYCDSCHLVQLVGAEDPYGIFDCGYKYYSSFSRTWLEHCEHYVEMIIRRLGLDESSKVLEIASNDGYLLQYFQRHGINPLGVEPSSSTADVAISKGIETIKEMFNSDFAKKLSRDRGKFDLVIANNVLAHVPYIGDFVCGISELLDRDGTATFEFPSLMELIKKNEFDTIYHEHFSYLSLIAVNHIFEKCGLRVYDIEEIDTHGGSLRVYACSKNSSIEEKEAVKLHISDEKVFGLDKSDTYIMFNDLVKKKKYDLWRTIIDLIDSGKTIAGYGAAAKGNTLFNYCGITKNEISFIADASPYKQGLVCPGSLIPIVDPSYIVEIKPDVVIIIPWNLEKEIKEQLGFIKEWGGVFLTLFPEICFS